MDDCFDGLMKVTKDAGGDYYIYLSEKGTRKIKNPVNSTAPLKYNLLSARVSLAGKRINEIMFLTCSNDSSVAFAPGGMRLDKEDIKYSQDSIVRIFPRTLDKLLKREERFLMTRYNSDNKVWVYMDE